MKKERIIQIGFSTSRRWNPFSALIKWWWGTPYSHTYIRWETPWGFEEIFEASGTSVRMVNDKRWDKKNETIHCHHRVVTREEFHELMTKVRPLAGVPYGWGQVIGLIVKEAFKLKKNPFSDGKNTLVCSELVLMALGEKSLDPDTVSPKDIYNLLQEIDD